jgi:tryptophan-rich sensory protein
MGVSLYLVWVAKSKQSKKLAFVAFGTQLALNAMWSLVFFGAQQPWLAVGVIIVLLAAIIWTMHEFRKFSRMASWLLVPYIIWVAFASALNVAVAFLN